jgi:hypothetical protein
MNSTGGNPGSMIITNPNLPPVTSSSFVDENEDVGSASSGSFKADSLKVSKPKSAVPKANAKPVFQHTPLLKKFLILFLLDCQSKS